MKIAIIGYSGSGKSTLAKKCGVVTGAPVLHMDRVNWLPGWQMRPQEEQRAMVTQFLDENKAWVIDGNYPAVEFERRMSEADHILLLAFNRVSCLGRNMRRVVRHRGENRPSMTEGNNERMNARHVWWVMYGGRTKQHRSWYDEAVTQYPEKVLVMKNQRELDAFVTTLMAAKPAQNPAKTV